MPANVTERGEASTISAHTSDMIELISGVCKVGPPGSSQAPTAVWPRMSCEPQSLKLLLPFSELGWLATQLPCYDTVQAYIDIPAEDEAIPPTKGAADRAVLDRLSISVNPKIFANRIQFIKDKKQLADVRTSTPLRELVTSGCVGGRGVCQ